MGRVPSAGQITIFEDNELRAFNPTGGEVDCLLSLGRKVGATNAAPVWNADANAVLVGNRGVLGPDSITPPLTARPQELPQWSRPSGSSVIYISEGRLMKRPSGGGEARDISFLRQHDAVAYHPAGEHIAASGLDRKGHYRLYLATNLGTRSVPSPGEGQS